METKAPIWHHGGLADDVAVLPSDVDWPGTSKDVEVDHPSNYVVFEVLSRGITVDVKIHTIAIQHEDPMSLAAAPTVLEVDWMVSVEVSS